VRPHTAPRSVAGAPRSSRAAAAVRHTSLAAGAPELWPTGVTVSAMLCTASVCCMHYQRPGVERRAEAPCCARAPQQLYKRVTPDPLALSPAQPRGARPLPQPRGRLAAGHKRPCTRSGAGTRTRACLQCSWQPTAPPSMHRHSCRAWGHPRARSQVAAWACAAPGCKSGGALPVLCCQSGIISALPAVCES